jgi:hypothetical protein
VETQTSSTQDWHELEQTVPIIFFFVLGFLTVRRTFPVSNVKSSSVRIKSLEGGAELWELSGESKMKASFLMKCEDGDDRVGETSEGSEEISIISKEKLQIGGCSKKVDVRGFYTDVKGDLCLL